MSGLRPDPLPRAHVLGQLTCISPQKELVGDYVNGGRDYQPKGKPERVQVHDLRDPEMPKAVPYGVYDIGGNEGWVSVGDDGDTAAFAVASIRTWWQTMGSGRYPDATRLLITADAGGSNGYRVRLWKTELAKLAAETGLSITVCHYPPGTSKWNKIEHRMFSFITNNWRAESLTSIRTIVGEMTILHLIRPSHRVVRITLTVAGGVRGGSVAGVGRRCSRERWGRCWW